MHATLTLRHLSGEPTDPAPRALNPAIHDPTTAVEVTLRQHHPDTRTAGNEQENAASDAALQRVLCGYALLHDPARRANTINEQADPIRRRNAGD